MSDQSQVNNTAAPTDVEADKKYLLDSETEEEHKRLLEQHKILQLLVDDRLYLAPVKEVPKTVLELATGTGVWAIEFANLHPTSTILGVDLVRAVPPSLPPNFTFAQLDLTTPSWDLPHPQYDLVHARLLFSIPLDFPALVARAVAALRPGGWLEFKEYVYPPVCPDGTLDGTTSRVWLDGMDRALAAVGRDWTVAARLDEYMRQAGLVDVACESFMVPVGGWPEDEKARRVGEWYGDYSAQYHHLHHALLGKGLGWGVEETDRVLAEVRRETVEEKTVHLGHEYRVIYGRKPE